MHTTFIYLQMLIGLLAKTDRISTMVVPLSFSREVNMRFISEVLILSLSIIALQSSIACSQKHGDHIKSKIFYSPKIELGPGMVAKKDVFSIEFPKGHIGIKDFDAELVDEHKNPIPLYDTYLHHWFAIRYHENIKIAEEYERKGNRSIREDMKFKRNEGVCNTNVLPHYWGLGGDSRRTNSQIPDPFAVEVGNPAHFPEGMQENWILNFMAIDTRGVKDRKACTECRCDAFNVPVEFLTRIQGLDNGKNLTTDYKGGFFCCDPKYPCQLEKGNTHQNRTIMLKYEIKWVDWDEKKVPLRFNILDVVDKVTYNGSQAVHTCMVEYDIPAKVEGGGPYDIRRTKIPMEQGGYLIYGFAHVHTGIVKATLFGEDGRVLCAVKPIYGKGNEPGNEKGYAVGMSSCHPQPGSVEIKKNETVTVEFVYESGYRTGVMGQFYIYLADSIPDGY